MRTTLILAVALAAQTIPVDTINDFDYEAAPAPDKVTRFAGTPNEAGDDIQLEVLDNKNPVPDGAIEVFVAQKMGIDDEGRGHYNVRVQSAPNKMIEQKLAIAAVRYLEVKNAQSFGTGAMGLAGQDDTATIGLGWSSYHVRVSSLDDGMKYEVRNSGQSSAKVLEDETVVMYSARSGKLRVTDPNRLNTWFETGDSEPEAMFQIGRDITDLGIDLAGTFLRRNPVDDAIVLSDGGNNVLVTLDCEEGEWECKVIGTFPGNFDGAIDVDGYPSTEPEAISFSGSARDGSFDFKRVPLDELPELAQQAYASAA